MCILAGRHMTAATAESSPTSLVSSAFLRIPTATYAAIGGAAAPFGPPLFDSDDLNEDALLNTCMRHIRRNQPSFSLSSIRLFRDATMLTGGQRSMPIHWVQYEKSNRLGKLYCRTGYHLLINNDGKVNGTHQDHNRFGKQRTFFLLTILRAHLRRGYTAHALYHFMFASENVLPTY
ncbi:Fibroblast growth factor 16 [Trichuris trichiura]|uniref:Fibroblast growth factor 16 n=1 Tax=Trichuris trichiura TaxID=36087 RepID=A0A077ZHI5_TRITR|nr:Fibroblast growth factor 16 [Trichuris trichiura]